MIFLDQYGGIGGGQVVLGELLSRLVQRVRCEVLCPPGEIVEYLRRHAPGAQWREWYPVDLRGAVRVLLQQLAASGASTVVVNGHASLLPAIVAKLVLRLRGRKVRVVLISHSRPATAHRRLMVRLMSRVCDARILVAKCLEGIVWGQSLSLELGVRQCDLIPADVAREIRPAPVVKAMGRDDPVKGLDLFSGVARDWQDCAGGIRPRFQLALSPSLQSQRGAGTQPDDGLRSDADRGDLALVGPKNMDWIEPDDLLVVPSLDETACLTAQEAMARGAIVVAAAVGDIPRFVKDGTSGFLFPGGDREGLRSALSRALDLSPAERQAMRAVARQTIEHRANGWYDSVEDYLLRADADAPAR